VSAPLTIGELAASTGLPTSTLRYYDRIGLIPATSRSGGQRRYDPKVIQRVRAVTLCQRSGFSLEETGRLLDGGRPWQALARRKVEELQGRIAELEQTTALLRSALECGCRSLETCGRAAHLAALAGPARGEDALRQQSPRAPRRRRPPASGRTAAPPPSMW
jgi:MerR family transcriptional regulator, redox-sensitive transcriptional activator SoxR